MWNSRRIQFWIVRALKGGIVNIRNSAYKLTNQPIQIKEPKNSGSIRKITLPKYCVNLLKLYRKEQNEERLKLGDQWCGNNWVFTQWDGQEMNPDTPSNWFPKFLKSHGLPHVKFHAPRHSSATLLLYSGYNIKAVASRLGHTQLATTNRYLHALQATDQAAADTFNGMFEKKAEKKNEQA
ncbi:MAG TPA: site-specific integrase [Oscillospiraceae bacterium]|nr:site-specific integrase [Oscillospiraceae bacterium]